MISMRTGNLVSLVSICIFSLTGCDPTTFASYFLENQLNEEIRIYIKFSDMSIIQTDTTILLEPQQEILYSNVEKIGREDYQEFDENIQLYDSIVAIRSDTYFLKISLINLNGFSQLEMIIVQNIA